MAVSKRTRYEVLRRDNHACRYCGAMAPDVKLTVDHVTPIALGGSDKPDNLVAACRDCNAGKSSTSPDAETVAAITDAELLWKRALIDVIAERMADRKARDRYVRRFEKAWRAQDFGDGGQYQHPRPRGWEASLWEFYAWGLPIQEVEEAVTIACGNTRIDLDAVWRYFCGVCHRKREAIIERAEAIAHG